MDADQPECPGPRRGELRQCRQCPREELSSYHLEASKRGTSHAYAKGPQSSTMTVLRSAFVEPPAIEAQVVVEAFGLRIERVMKKCRGSGGYTQQGFRLFS